MLVRNLYRTISFLAILITTGFALHGQSFYYLESVISKPDASTIKAYSFLELNPDGTAMARVRFMSNDKEENTLIEYQLEESTSVEEAQDSIRNLIPIKNGIIIKNGNKIYNYLPRFVFKITQNNNDAFITVENIEFLSEGNVKNESVLKQNFKYSLEDIKKKQPVLKVFYDTTDAYYEYLTNTQLILKGSEPSDEKMFVIVVTNTLDDSIGLSCQKDGEVVKKFFTRIGKDIGLPVENIIITEIKGAGFTKVAVEKALNNLKPSKKDIIVFYYSGHGFRFSKDKSSFTRLSFMTKTNRNIDENIKVEDVFERFKKLRARVGLVIVDCCNNDVGDYPGLGIVPLRGTRGVLSRINMTNASPLFFPKEPYCIVIGSSDPGQKSFGNPLIGGYFTNSLITLLDAKLYSVTTQSTYWPVLIEEVKIKTQRLATGVLCCKGCDINNNMSRCNQTPRFEMYPKF